MKGSAHGHSWRSGRVDVSGAELGSHRLAVVASDRTLIGWGDIRITAASTSALPLTGLELGMPIAASLLLLVAGAALVLTCRRRSV